MNINKTTQNGYSILYVEGRIDSTNFNEFEKEIVKTIDSGQLKLVLNCKGLNYISSSGLRVFLIAQKKLMALKGNLLLCEMQPPIKEIFDISGFSSIFKIYNTENDALQA